MGVQEPLGNRPQFTLIALVLVRRRICGLKPLSYGFVRFSGAHSIKCTSSPKPPNAQNTKPSTDFEIGTLHSKPIISLNSTLSYLSQCTRTFLNIELGRSGPNIAILVPSPPQPKFRVHVNFCYMFILCYSILFVRLLNVKSSYLNLQP